jgi:hypothetical protein
MVAGRDKKQVPPTENPRPDRDLPGHYLKDCELWYGICRAGLVKEESVDAKAVTCDQRLIFALPKGWLVIIEIDASQRLFDVELPRLTVEAKPVPIKDAIGCIAVLLNFKDKIACINGMEPAARDKYKIVLPARYPMEEIRDRGVRQSRFEIVFARPLFQADVDTGPFVGGHEVPKLRLGFIEEFDRSMARRVDLNGEDIGGIQDLYKDRKTRVLVSIAKYLGALTDPELVQRDSAKFRLGNDTLGV